MNTQQKIYTVAGSSLVLATAGIVGYVLFATPDSVSQSASTTSSVGTSQTSPVATSTAPTASSGSSSTSYKDGTYTASINYNVPHGDTNSLTINLTVSGGKITAVTPSNNYQDHESREYIDSFDSSISGEVVGQSLNGLSVGQVGGASLTSSAFNDVLDTIRNEAKV